MPEQASNCPCGSGKATAQCCDPYIKGILPAPTAETLMRSRFTAYTVQNTEYLITTTHPWQQNATKKQNLYEQSGNTLWQRLEVIETKAGKTSDQTGIVEFRAWFQESLTGPEKALHQRSSFMKLEDRWYYIYPGMPMSNTHPPGRNDPCPCGSGKKYKKCCLQCN